MPMGCLIIDYLVGVSFKKQYLHYYPIMTNFQDNKRIAKNTLLLYFRMFFTILVGLYTSRIVLAVLDVEDYGIYNVVGGVVAMFGFLNSAMIATSQRFIAYELGRGTWERLQKVFSMSINIHFLIAAGRFIIIGNDWGLVFKCENEHPCTSFECCKLGISMLNIRFSHQYYWGTV